MSLWTDESLRQNIEALRIRVGEGVHAPFRGAPCPPARREPLSQCGVFPSVALSESFGSVSLYTGPLIGDLLKLVHLSNDGNSGETVRVSGHALHEGNPAIEEVQSTFFFRGSFTYDENIFGRLMSLNTLLSLSGVLMFES